ncbi:heavy metal translocatin [Trametes elegans]|nr:heavy metal translocatin [Trametes elegans]
MVGCCSDCNSQSDARSVDSHSASNVNSDDVTKQMDAQQGVTQPGEQGGCCGSGCDCDETCFEELARVICADDDNHIHHPEPTNGASTNITTVSASDNDSQSVVSDCTCCDNDSSDTTPERGQEESQDKSTSAPPADSESGYAGLRRRTAGQRSCAPAPPPKKACGEHQSIAKSRYNDTLAAFGCVCKALLARGCSSCCSTPLHGKAVARSTSSRQSIRLVRRSRGSDEISCRSSVDSCCAKGDCAKASTSSIRNLSYRGHAVSQKKKTQSCVSVDSCCDDSCCGQEASADREEVKDKTSEHVALDMAGEPASIPGEHIVLAIKGMTCTGCEKKLNRTLSQIPFIRNAKTSLVLCRAEFDLDDSDTDLAALIQTIEKRSGFSAEIMQGASRTTRDLLLTVLPSLQETFFSAPRPEGVQDIVKYDKASLRVVYDPTIIGARKVLQFYEAFSPALAPEPQDPALTAGMKHIRSLALRTVSSAVLTIPVLVMTWAPLPPHPRAYSIASLVLATIVQTCITGPFYISAFKSLMFSHVIEIELLIVLSTTTAYVYSLVAFAFDMLGRPLSTGEFFETSTLLVTLIMVGQLVSAIARQRAIEAISIRSLQERNARIVLADGTDQLVDVRLLQYNDHFKVLPDSAIITDGIVVSGTSTVDESMMTGESRPVEKASGSAVMAGTHNGPSTLIVKVTRLPGENTISDIAGMVDDARISRARVQETVDWVCGWFVPAILVLTTITFVVWLAVGTAVRKQPAGEAVVVALTYAISVLAISCPCAIGLAVPMVILIANGVGAKLGVLFKAATTIEQARKVTHVVLDKTGTVTQGRLSVVSGFVDENVDFDIPATVLALISSSRHPVARAVASKLEGTLDASSKVARRPPVEDIEMVTGKGVQGTLLGQPLRGGSAAWLGLESNPAVKPLLAQDLTAFCVVHGSRLLAAFGLSDILRPEARSVVNALVARNIRISILSGDHAAAVYSTAAELGVPEERVRAGCLPGDKQAYIKQLIEEGETVLFCGDGTNDAVALAQAAIGVHLHTGEGAGVAASSAADVVLTHPSLIGLLTLLELSDAVARRIAANFAWAFVYNLVAILLAAGAFVDARVPPAYAGLGELVSVLPVVLVAVQLKWFKPSV